MPKPLKAAVNYISSFQVSTLAASASFFMILSLLPLATLVLSLLRYLPLTLDDLLQGLEQVMPEAMMVLVVPLTRELYTSNAFAVISVTVLTALWSASRGVYGIQVGINTIMGSSENRSYVRRRLTAVLYTFLFIIAVFITLGLQVFGQTLLHIIDGWDFWLLEPITQLVRLRFLFTTALLALLFTLIFAFFPAKRMHLRDVFPSALATAVGWLAFSYFFSIYVEHGGGSRFYGSLATVVLGMLWLYFCMTILFYGGVLCRLSEEGYLKKFLPKW